MRLDQLRDLCLALPETTEGQPFGPDVLVFKVSGKMFALLSLSALPSYVNLKCDPERAVELRERHDAVTPGYHMNKQQWNSVRFGSLPAALVHDLVEHSYRLVAAKLKKADRQRVEAAEGYPATSSEGD